MEFPYVSAEIMFTSPTWTDVSGFLRSATITRGSTKVDSPVIRYEAGTAQVVLDNRDARFDPTNLAGPYVEGFTADTEDMQFLMSRNGVFGHGVSLSIKSATGQSAAIVNVTSKSSGTTGSYSVTKPGGVVSGQRMIAIASCDYGDVSSMGVSGGSAWTPLFSLTFGTNTLNTRAWYKTTGGSEPSTYSFTQDSGADGVGCVIAVSGADTSSVPVWNYADNPERKLFDTPGVTPSLANDLDIRWCGANAYDSPGISWQSPTGFGFTEYVDKQSQDFTAAVLACRQLSGVVGTGTATRVLPSRPIRLRARWDFTPTTNLIQNPSFELDTTGWVPLGSTSLTTADAESYSGDFCLRIQRNLTSSGFTYGAECSGTTAGATTGQTVTLSAYVFLPAASFPKVTSIQIGATGLANATVTKPPAADGWYRITRTGVLTTNLDDVRVRFITDDSHGDGQVVAYLDAVQAEVKSAATPYGDGDQPGCVWTGTAHASSTTRASSTTFDLFKGEIDDWLLNWTANVDAEVTLPCTDGFIALSDVDRVALAVAVGAGELSGARVDRILTSADWPLADRDIDAGNTTLSATTMDGDALTELFLVADTELGEFYCNGSGNMVFRSRKALSTDARSKNNQVKFGDGGDVRGELPYEDVGITYESTQLKNDIRIARTGGTQQSASDSLSIDEFRRRTFERTDLLMETEAEALAYANWLLYVSKDPELRFDTLAVLPQKDPANLFPQVLAREIGDRVLIRRQPVGRESQIEREVFLRGITHTIGQYTWHTDYVLQSATRFGSFLTLNHPVLGIIGQNAIGY